MRAKYSTFLCTIRKRILLNAQGTYEELAQITLHPLMSEQGLDAVAHAATHLTPTAYRALALELDLVVEREKTDRFLKDAGTVKDSLEQLLGDWLPDWIKELLEILNEILKLK